LEGKEKEEREEGSRRDAQKVGGRVRKGGMTGGGGVERGKEDEGSV
jgi:hypothetical protein